VREEKKKGKRKIVGYVPVGRSRDPSLCERNGALHPRTRRGGSAGGLRFLNKGRGVGPGVVID